MNDTPALRVLAKKLGHPLGAPTAPREIFELVQRYRRLTPGGRLWIRAMLSTCEETGFDWPATEAPRP